MSAFKIIYGIDLGTTNSAITRFEKGKAVVKKNSMQKDTTPSCVAYNKKGHVIVGDKAHTQQGKDYAMVYRKPGYRPNTFVEFKRLMGTDHKYECPNLGKSITPEELSSQVLMELKKNINDDDVLSAVITVPAMFNNTQKDATKHAAKLAGFDHVELIQEPVAASIAYGLDSKMKNAYWVVFDFGGGTFDAALMKIEDGIIQAVDTAGNNKLGGKDIDNAIVDEIIMPYLKNNYTLNDILEKKGNAFVNMWKPKAEEIKIALSSNEEYEAETDLGDNYGVDDNGEEIAISLTVTREQVERVAEPIFQKAVNITKALLQRNHIEKKSLGALILVGGPTFMPIVRRMLKEQVTPNVDTSIDPMTCVAEGAAIYGSTIDVPKEIADSQRDRSKVQLAINYQSTSVETEEWISVSFLENMSESYADDSVMVEFVRGDGMFTSPQSEIDTEGDVIVLQLAKNKTNVFSVRCYDKRGNRLDCEPGEISIIQGTSGFDNSVMPMALGIGALNSEGTEVFTQVRGLEKSRRLPASGSIRNMKTPKIIRPGVDSDKIRITIYQIEDFIENARVLYCQRIYDTYITGDDVPQVINEGSVVNLSMHAEKSGTIDKFEAEIPSLGITIDLTERMTASRTTMPDRSFMEHEFHNARQRARELGDQTIINRIDIAEQRYFANPDNRDVADGAYSELQSICRELDRLNSMGEWERQEKKLRSMYEELCSDNQRYGNAETKRIVDGFAKELESVVARKDVQLAKDLYSRMWNYDFKIAEVDFYKVWITEWNTNFQSKRWRNPTRARELINEGLRCMSGNPTAEQLNPIAFGLMDLLPEHDKPNILGGPE